MFNARAMSTSYIRGVERDRTAANRKVSEKDEVCKLKEIWGEGATLDISSRIPADFAISCAPPGPSFLTIRSIGQGSNCFAAGLFERFAHPPSALNRNPCTNGNITTTDMERISALW
jgi:hypothetical protein